MATVYRYSPARQNHWLNPAPMPGFNSLRAARSFASGYVTVDRVVANRRTRREPFVVVHPRTAKRNGWRVVS